MELSSVPLATDYSIQHYLLNIDSKNRNGYFITQLKPCLDEPNKRTVKCQSIHFSLCLILIISEWYIYKDQWCSIYLELQYCIIFQYIMSTWPIQVLWVQWFPSFTTLFSFPQFETCPFLRFWTRLSPLILFIPLKLR